jgi:hypothetical protein
MAPQPGVARAFLRLQYLGCHASEHGVLALASARDLSPTALPISIAPGYIPD